MSTVPGCSTCEPAAGVAPSEGAAWRVCVDVCATSVCEPEHGLGAHRTLQQVALAEAALAAARESLATVGSALGGAPALPPVNKQEPAG